jgi:hypothetical protein
MPYRISRPEFYGPFSLVWPIFDNGCTDTQYQAALKEISLKTRGKIAGSVVKFSSTPQPPK